MALTVEDGSGLVDADSYVSVADCSSYCDARGLSFSASTTGEKEAALIRATQAIDAIYRSRFPGMRHKFRDQALEWPRVGAVDAAGYPITQDVIPVEIAKAVCEAAVRELAEPSSMLPDLDRGGSIQQITAGSVSITYGGNATANTARQIIDGILSGLLGARAQYTGSSARG